MYDLICVLMFAATNCVRIVNRMGYLERRRYFDVSFRVSLRSLVAVGLVGWNHFQMLDVEDRSIRFNSDFQLNRRAEQIP